MYEVYLERRAERDLNRLSADDFQRVISHIKALANDPRPPGCRKLSGSANDWRIRVGAHRIVYEIRDDEQRVRVMLVKHRREVYR